MAGSIGMWTLRDLVAWIIPMPHKFNAARRMGAQYRVINWDHEYNESLRQRGSDDLGQ